MDGQFHTTRWSLVLAGHSESCDGSTALNYLCSHYWEPLYIWLRHRGYSIENAEDLIQGFFESVLENPGFLDRADAARGKFRSYIIGALKNYVRDHHKFESAARRGGKNQVKIDIDDVEGMIGSVDDISVAYDRNWALSLMKRALGDLEKRCQTEMDMMIFDWLSGESSFPTLAALAADLNASEESVRTRLSRMRRNLRSMVDIYIRETVATSEDFEEERTYLVSLLRTF